MTSRPSITILLLVFTALAGPTPGQDADQLDEWLLKAEDAFQRGRDRKGLSYVRKVIAASPMDAEALALGIGPAMNVGEYDLANQWSEAWVKAGPDPRRGRLARARVLLHLGRLEAVAEVLKPLLAAAPGADASAPSLDFQARALMARAHLRGARRGEAEALFDSLVQEAKRVVVREPGALVALADAYVFFRGLREAEKVLLQAQKAAARSEPIDPTPSMALADLYLDRFYIPGDAVTEYKEALQARPRLAAATWGLHRAFTAWQKGAEANDARRRTLTTNPKHKAALCAKAADKLGDMSLDEAQALLDQVFAIDPTLEEGLALQAVLHRFANREEEGAAAWKRLTALYPERGKGHLVAARVLNQRRRWPEALAECRLATARAPKDPEGWDELSRYAFFLGLEDEGYAALRRADDVDRFSHPWRRNMFENRRVIGKYYREFETRHFVHRVHRKELDAFKPYLIPFCRKSWNILTKKYEFDPPGLVHKPGKVLVEWFKDHGDFSVRTLGFTHLGATGVCFGPFIGMNSPGARRPGEFSWARTFHHELAHTMTVGLSKGRTPRWLTEGLSTYEEKCFNPAWDRGLYRQLHSALANDDLCKVLTFDSNFGGPRITFAYFQGGLVCEWMVERFGMPKVLAMLRAYGEDGTTAEILPSVLEITPEAFDDEFEQWIAARMEPVKLQPRLSRKGVSELESRLAAKPDDGDALIGLAVAYSASKNTLDAQEMVYRAERAGISDPRLHLVKGRIALANKVDGEARKQLKQALDGGLEDHDLRVSLANLAERAGDAAEAVEHWKAALATFPMISGRTDPRTQLSRICAGTGDLEGAIRWLEEHVSVTYEDLEARKKLVDWYRSREDKAAMKRHLSAMINVYPLDRSVHEGLGELYLEERRGDDAVTEFEVALALQQLTPEQDRSPADEAGLRVMLAKALMLDEDSLEEASAQVKLALELVPGHAEARSLKRIIEAARGPDGVDRK